jgi:peptidoglycan/xylan/chitin deacetylase (PgdA/CDA1 family)
MTPTILLSYDVEEFDMPMEYGGQLELEQQLEISTKGLQALVALLERKGIRCTLYCTAQFSLHRKELIQELHNKGFEIASHGYFHSSFEVKDLRASREVLEDIISYPVHGYRMARMKPLDAADVEAAGYKYNSSLNPTWLPGRYNNLKKPRGPFVEKDILQFPASVTPGFRIPLFWISFHNFPLAFYQYCCQRTLQRDEYLNVYFHPWEFQDYTNAGNAKFPSYLTRNTGNAMLERTERLIEWARSKGYRFDTTRNWLLHKQLINV